MRKLSGVPQLSVCLGQVNVIGAPASLSPEFDQCAVCPCEEWRGEALPLMSTPEAFDSSPLCDVYNPGTLLSHTKESTLPGMGM